MGAIRVAQIEGHDFGRRDGVISPNNHWLLGPMNLDRFPLAQVVAHVREIKVIATSFRPRPNRQIFPIPGCGVEGKSPTERAVNPEGEQARKIP
jgi:hypothetical protein